MTMLILVSPALMNQELQSLSDKHQVSNSSPDFEFIELAHNSIQLLNGDELVFTNRFVLTDSVMDSFGATYVTGNLKEYDMMFGDISVDFNNARSQNPPMNTPIVAKLSVTGDWEWVFAPQPKPGADCNPSNSVMTEDDATGVVNAISLSKSETDLAIVGNFYGCYQFGTEMLFNDGDVRDGFITRLNTDGVSNWSAIIDADGSPAPMGMPPTGVYLDAVVFSDNGELVFVGGSINNATVDAAYSGGRTLLGDENSDAYISAHRVSDGIQVAHRDSCLSNDPDSAVYSDCNGGGKEQIATLDILNGDIVAGINVHATGVNSISVFDSTTTTHGDNTSTVLAWLFDESNPLVSSIDDTPPTTFGLDHLQSHQIKESHISGEDVIIAIDGETEEDLALGSVNTDSAIIFEGHPSTNWIIPLGFVTVRNSDDFFVFTSKGAANYAIYDSGVPLSNFTTQGAEIIFVAMDKDYTDFTYFDGVSEWTDQTTIASNGDYASVFGLNSKHDAIVLTPDSDLDGIPNLYDIHMHIPASSDPDNDGIVTSQDNCPNTWNVDQLNLDMDGDGDACDTDIDGDDVTNSIPLDLSHPSNIDMCPFTWANNSKDSNGDGCEDDSDADGIPDYLDLCPGSDDGVDLDQDGIIDGCDIYPGDTDNDGVVNLSDNCIFIYNPDQGNLDGDLQGDECDGDIDGDGITNTVPLDVENPANLDKCPYTNVSGFVDDDNDGCIDHVVYDNNTNNDTDNDGILNEFDICPNGDDSLDADNDQTPDACDYDIDGDGVNNSLPVELNNSDNYDRCPYVDATDRDENRDGCIDENEACEICEDPVEGNGTEPLLDPDDVETVVVVGGTGAVGGGALALILSKLRRASRFIGVDDGLEALKHLPKRKKEDAGSDHYFQRGLVRQREMTLSADKNLDDYIEDNEKEGVEKK